MVETKTIAKTFTVLLFIILFFSIIASLYGTASDAGDELNDSGLPLGSLFMGGGVFFIVASVGVLFATLRMIDNN